MPLEPMVPQHRLRVAVACSGLGHIARGIEAWAADLARALRQHPGDVDVALFSGAPFPDARAIACWRRGGAVAPRLSGLARHLGGWRFGLGSAYEVEQISFALSLWRRIGRDFDILHVQDPLIAMLLERAHRLGLSRPQVILANGTGEPPAVLRRFAHLQHLTPAAAAAWEPTRPPAQAGFTIPNFIDPARFVPADRAAARRRLGLPDDRIVIFCAAAIRRGHKRIDVLLREFTQANAASGGRMFLVVAGGREAETPEIIDQAAALPGAAIRISVSVPRDEITDLYNAADAFILPSLHEMFGIVLLEAMSCGLPVICHDAPEFRFVAGPAGLFRDLSAEGGIADAITAIRDPDLRASLAARARPHVEAQFSAAAVAPQVVSMYRTVAARREAPA